jgi:hypothetical protein
MYIAVRGECLPMLFSGNEPEEMAEVGIVKLKSREAPLPVFK